MTNEARRLSRRLALEPTLSDYDFWRMAKSLDDALYRAERSRAPIPMDLIFARVVVRHARSIRMGEETGLLPRNMH